MFIKSKTVQALDLYGELFCADLLTSKVQDIRREYKNEVERELFAKIYQADDKESARKAIADAIGISTK